MLYYLAAVEFKFAAEKLIHLGGPPYGYTIGSICGAPLSISICCIVSSTE